jgi:hypothetical protein
MILRQSALSQSTLDMYKGRFIRMEHEAIKQQLIVFYGKRHATRVSLAQKSVEDLEIGLNASVKFGSDTSRFKKSLNINS